MKQFLLFASMGSLCFLGLANNATAETKQPFQEEQKDSIPSRILPKVRVTVKDLNDGTALDSVLITTGFRKAYTDQNGSAELDSVIKESVVVATRDGYLLTSKKAKADITLRLP